ncbi:MAG: MBL fold metallo-hydrolase [Desulfocucumaceae bacterium]
MKVASGVEALEISMNIMGTPGIIYPSLIWDNHTVILVDAGYPGQLPQIRVAIEKAGVSFAKLDKVIVTHHDLDHTGSLSSILKDLPQKVEVLAHEEEKPYIQAERRPTKMTQVEDRLKSMPDGQGREMKVFYEYLRDNYENLRAPVHRTLADGEDLPYCGGITVIYTPGHTPGHICLYHKQSKTLIAGDALLLEGGLLVPSQQFTNLDTGSAIRSLKKLTRYDIEKVICYHGGLYEDHTSQRIAELANGQH